MLGHANAQNYEQFDKENMTPEKTMKNHLILGYHILDNLRSNNDIGGLLLNYGVVACICSL